MLAILSLLDVYYITQSWFDNYIGYLFSQCGKHLWFHYSTNFNKKIKYI